MDDALSVRELPSGEIEVGVHIADVSHFVPQVSCFIVDKLMSSPHQVTQTCSKTGT